MQGDNHPAKRDLAEARERTVAILAECFAKDELGLEAFEQRVNDAYQCATVEGLGELVRDRKGQPTSSSVTALAPVAREVVAAQIVVHPSSKARPITAILGSVERRGALNVAGGARAVAILGSLQIDLRETQLPPGPTEIHVRAVLGSVEIFVPADIVVEVEGVGILGSVESSVRVIAGADANTPRLRIIGTAVLGSVEVHARPPARVELLVKQLRGKT